MADIDSKRKPATAGYFYLQLMVSKLAAYAVLLATYGVKNNRLFYYSGLDQPHLLSPQFRQVKQPSMMMAALVLHLPHN